MTDQKYILKGKELVPATLMEWGVWFGTTDRHVAKTKVFDAEVSTVCLGMDHSYGMGPKLYFETMIFGGNYDEFMLRYENWEQAEKGHWYSCVLALQPIKKRIQLIFNLLLCASLLVLMVLGYSLYLLI